MKRRQPEKLSKYIIANALRVGFGEEAYIGYLLWILKDEILPNAVGGNVVYSYFDEVKFYRGTLNIRVTSAPLKANLMSEKSNLIAKINKEIGSEFVRNIVFL